MKIVTPLSKIMNYDPPNRATHTISSYPPYDRHIDEHDPIFRAGDILRYENGSTALFQVEHISERHGGRHRYYGQHCMGGSHASYEYGCQLASEKDIKKWKKRKSWRREFKQQDTTAVGNHED